MYNYYPVLVVGAVLGLITVLMFVGWSALKKYVETRGERTMTDRAILRRLAAYAKPHIGTFIFVGALMLVSIVYTVIGPYVIGEIEELIKGEFAVTDLIWRVTTYALIMIVSLASSYVQSIILQKTGQKIVSKIREDTFTHIESLSHGQLTEQPVGKLVTRVSNDAESVSRLFTNVVINLFKNVFIIIGITAAMFALHYALALVVMCFAPFIVIFTALFRRFARTAFRREKEATTDINTFLSENLSGMKITQSFNREAFKSKDFHGKSAAHARAGMHTVYVFSVFRPTVYMLYIASVLFIFYFGAKGYLDGGSLLGLPITGGVIVSFYMYVEDFFDPVQNLAEQFNVLQSALASAEKIFLLMDVAPAITDEEGAIELENVKGEIEFKNVWFAYKDEDWVLKDVSFKINAFETVAFVGETGAGKTTILSLLCRNYDVTRGAIYLDGVDIRRIKISSLRSHFGQMPQDVFLFSGTVRSNITLRDDVSDDVVMEACRYVNADKLINKLPKGLDEEVLERSNNFSAGERQLLSFARMIMHRPEVMILDEATANIDTETETLIQNSLEKLMKHGTMLIVAHRLSTVRRADKIIVMSHGEMIEQGNHSELIEKKGKYYQLYILREQRELTKKSETA